MTSQRADSRQVATAHSAPQVSAPQASASRGLASQVWQPERYDRQADFVEAGGTPVLELLSPRAGEDILDLGCGSGGLTNALLEAGARVVGVDSSEDMIRAAREKHPNVQFEVADGERLDYEASFDAVFSNAALHWMLDAKRVARGVYRVLRPRGRFAAEFGGHGNVQRVREAIAFAAQQLGISSIPQPYRPWYFPKLGEYSSLLESVGFDVRFANWFQRPSPMADTATQSGIAAWCEIFAQSAVKLVPSGQRAEFFAAVEEHARPELHRDGTWHIDYVRLRILATR